MRVCVIGAGPSGLSFLYHHQRLRNEMGPSLAYPEVVCYEKQSDWGGMWRFDWRTGTDEFGQPVHGSMYRHLWCNSPKEGLEYPDYTFERHFNKNIASYAPREVILDYLIGRMISRGSELRSNIQFNKVVQAVSFCADADAFRITVKDLKRGSCDPEETFDYVMVCCGHFSVPNVPHFSGFESFDGSIIHSHDFRSASFYKNQRVLIVGSGKSAEDIATQCFKFGCSSIIVSYRNKPMEYEWPPEISQRPQLIGINQKTALFQDGSAADIDAIILCTGYLNHFPFMDPELRLDGPTNDLYPDSLFKGTLWTEAGNARLMYVGMLDPVYSFTMFDIQAVWCLHHILGLLPPTSVQAMRKDIQAWTDRKRQVENVHDAIDFQTDYVKDLCTEVGYPFDLDTADLYHVWERSKTNILNYRDMTYMSKFSGIQAAPHHTNFMDAFDDSLSNYIGTDKYDSKQSD